MQRHGDPMKAGLRVRAGMRTTSLALFASAAVIACVGVCAPARAQTAGSDAPASDQGGQAAAQDDADQPFAFHAQSTLVVQGHPRFTSPYSGTNSFDASPTARETFDLTFYAGMRLWKGGEVWVNPEIDQGFGLSDTVGIAGYPSGEAYKVGAVDPYIRVQRVFVRQTFDLGGESQKVDADLNQMSGSQTANRVVVTVGKMSVGDIFDTNTYAHDPRHDFLNWSIIDAGTFDYAADSWGYSAGAAVEWYQGRWTLRGGAYLLSNVPNSEFLDTRFNQFQLEAELEERHTIAGQPGKIKVTGFLSRGRMAKLDDATALAAETGTIPDPALVRRYSSRPGISINVEQQVTDGLGVFARAGMTDGRYEAYEFTDVDRSVSGGASLSGKRWGRENDTFALAGVVNAASAQREAFLDAGGLGILIGDGRLPHPGTERIVETYYDLGASKGAHVALDYQYVVNPGYNEDRGPVSIFALRLHGQF